MICCLARALPFPIEPEVSVRNTVRLPDRQRVLCQTCSEQGNRGEEITKKTKQPRVPLEEREVVAALHLAVGEATALEVQSLFFPAEYLSPFLSTWRPNKVLLPSACWLLFIRTGLQPVTMSHPVPDSLLKPVMA